MEKFALISPGRSSVMYVISAIDTSGSITLKRLSFTAALKKARELIEDHCWGVQIVDPDGRIYTSADFGAVEA